VRSQLLRIADFLHVLGDGEAVELAVFAVAQIQARRKDCFLERQQQTRFSSHKG
jgi:hypothetical protein